MSKRSKDQRDFAIQLGENYLTLFNFNFKFAFFSKFFMQNELSFARNLLYVHAFDTLF